jgi:hypothetical protein
VLSLGGGGGGGACACASAGIGGKSLFLGLAGRETSSSKNECKEL